MTIDDLSEQSKKDLKLERDNLDYESLRTPDIFHKYNRLRGIENLRLKKFTNDFKTLFLKRWEFYSGKAEDEDYNKEAFFKKVMKADKDIYLDGDLILQESKSKIEYQEEIVDMLERILKQINQRDWSIKNAIEFLKFSHGSGN